MLTDPIADLLTRIRNASHARRRSLTLRSSKMKKAIAEVLAAKRFIENAEEVKGAEKYAELQITLRTDRDPLELTRVSKPGQRIYIGYDEIPRVRNGLGMAVVSTSRGIMPGDQATKEKLGGEFICKVY